MKYKKISALVPEGEHFDESAITNEGVWLSANHLNAIESEMQQGDTALDAVAAQITDLSIERDSAREEAAQATETIATQNQTITELQAQVSELGKRSSGKGTVIASRQDEQHDTPPVPSYLRDDNPANQYVDKRLKRK